MAASDAPEKLCGTAKWATLNSGFPHDLSPEQGEELGKFKEQATAATLDAVKFPHETHDDVACRFMRARKFSVEDALTMIRACQEWRKAFNMEYVMQADPDELLGCSEEEILYFWPQTRLPHTDVDSRPVYIEKTGRIDVAGLLSVSDMDSLVKWHVHCTEVDSGKLYRGITQEIKDGSRKLTNGATSVAQGTNILDMDNFSLGMFMGDSKEYLGRISKISQDYYPETMGKMFIVNAPVIFTTVWAVVKGWLDPRTVAKIGLYGGPSEYKEPLFAQLGGADKTPVEYGGTWTRPGGKPLFSAAVKTQTMEKQSTFKAVVPLAAGQRFLARWWADADEVSFGVQWFPGATKEPAAGTAGTEVFAEQLIKSCTGPTNVTGASHTPPTPEGKVEGDHLGVYVVTWGNAHKGGWVSSGTRTITYCALAKDVKPRGKVYVEEVAAAAAAKAAGGVAGATGGEAAAAPAEATPVE